MRIRTTGLMLVETEMERLRIDDPFSPSSDAERYPSGQILRTALQFVSDLCWQEWEMGESFIDRESQWSEHPRAHEKDIALAAALLIRELDRLEFVRLEAHITPPSQSTDHA